MVTLPAHIPAQCWRARIQISSLTKDHRLHQWHLVHVKSVVGAAPFKFSLKSILQGQLFQTDELIQGSKLWDLSSSEHLSMIPKIN